MITGALLADQPQRERDRIRDLLALFPILWPDETTLERFAAVRVAQRRAGTPLGVRDNWIAALALQYDLPVATDDVDFNRVEGLRIASWK